jgi:hypothetical protein
MKLSHIQEPYLEFGQGQHICPRAGIAKYGVYDSRFTARRDKILIGAIGTSETLSKLKVWLERCAKPIPAKLDSRQPNLYPLFCGFNRQSGFQADLIFGDEITRTLYNSDVNRITKIEDWNERVEAAVELYYQHTKFLAQNRVVDAIVCTIPTPLYDSIAKREDPPVEETVEDDSPDDILEMNFRRALKACSMHLGVPLQLMRELSLEPHAAGQQDDATKAWNFCTAIYYKANQTAPWRLITNVNRPSVCYAGIGFYRSRDRKVLNTSLAQVFDELGNSVILRGTPVDVDKDDRRPHLTANQAYELLDRALAEYEVALSSPPARLVIHKSSKFNDAELDGFQQAADERRVRVTDFVTILDTNMRLLREGNYPPYRGTCIELNEVTHLLYTRGAVEYYKTYPGLYIPQPLEVRIAESDESPGVICEEILALTKMNWNNTQFDGKYPITIECARRVGQIMKYLGPNEHPQISYSFYM